MCGDKMIDQSRALPLTKRLLKIQGITNHNHLFRQSSWLGKLVGKLTKDAWHLWELRTWERKSCQSGQSLARMDTEWMVQTQRLPSAHHTRSPESRKRTSSNDQFAPEQLMVTTKPKSQSNHWNGKKKMKKNDVWWHSLVGNTNFARILFHVRALVSKTLTTLCSNN